MTLFLAPPMSAERAVEPVEGELVTPSDLVDAVRAARATVAAAEAQVYRLALAWADAHPEVDGEQAWHAAGDAEDAEESAWRGLPRLRWDAPAAFAAANAMSTIAGRAYLRDALVVRHRLPQLHARVASGAVPVWRARRIAQAVAGLPDDVVAYTDAQVAGRAETLGLAALDRVIDEARLRLCAEEREMDQLDALDARYATLHEREVNHTGIAEMTLRADLPDLKDFDRALSDVAAALLAHPDPEHPEVAHESLDVRRAMAVGILADPVAAAALLAGDDDWSAKLTIRRVELVVHLTDLGLRGADALTREAQPDRVLLTQTVQAWCGRPGTHVTVRPVLDLAVPVAVDHYRPSGRQVDHVAARDRHCVFPHCTRSARSCDTDHVQPWDDTGPPDQTRTDNLAALCRHHHRLKTHAGWRLSVLAPATYLWTDPHGQVLLRTADGGTTDLTVGHSASGVTDSSSACMTSSTRSAMESTTRVGR